MVIKTMLLRSALSRTHTYTRVQCIAKYAPWGFAYIGPISCYRRIRMGTRQATIMITDAIYTEVK